MSIAYKISSFNRKRKWKSFNENMAINGRTKILDVGFSDQEYSATDNYMEKNYPFPENLTALGIDQPVEFKERYPQVNVVQYDGNLFPFQDKSFDVCWSNAVIEHVGDGKRQLVFLKEIKRVAKTAFITTPNRFFPVEVHTRVPFLHYLPKKTFDKILCAIGKKWAAGDYMHLLSIEEIEELLRKAEIKEYKIIKNKLLLFTLDYIIIF